jgi:hypothetical protein
MRRHGELVYGDAQRRWLLAAVFRAALLELEDPGALPSLVAGRVREALDILDAAKTEQR